MNILLSRFGSHVYGTNTAESDTDYKGIFIPEARDILLQRAPKQIINNTKKNSTDKNSKDDVDTETWSLHQYLKLLAEGQTPAIDLLFTPKEFHIERSEIFDEIFNNKHKILSKNLTPVIAYSRTQAAKYGLKGSRVAAFRNTLTSLEQMEETCDLLHAKNFIILLNLIYKTPEKFISFSNNLERNNEYINFVYIKNKQGEEEPYLEVCGKRYALHLKVKYLKDQIQEKIEVYGRRALAAENNGGG